MNGFYIGFMEIGEWMQYELDVMESGVYDIYLRVVFGGFGGRLYFVVDGIVIMLISFMFLIGGW